MYGYYGLDWTYLLVLLGVGLTLGAQAFLKSTFARYAKVQSSTGLTGREVAEQILRANGIYDVTVQAIGGQLTDHYDPAKKTVNLSEVIYDSRTLPRSASRHTSAAMRFRMTRAIFRSASGTRWYRSQTSVLSSPCRLSSSALCSATAEIFWDRSF